MTAEKMAALRAMIGKNGSTFEERLARRLAVRAAKAKRRLVRNPNAEKEAWQRKKQKLKEAREAKKKMGQIGVTKIPDEIRVMTGHHTNVQNPDGAVVCILCQKSPAVLHVFAGQPYCPDCCAGCEYEHRTEIDARHAAEEVAPAVEFVDPYPDYK